MSDTESQSTDPLNLKIARQLRTVRHKMGVSQREACRQVFETESMQGMWSRWERGLIRPNVGTLEKIARWAGVSVAAFGVHEPAGTPTSAELDEARELLQRAIYLLGGK